MSAIAEAPAATPDVTPTMSSADVKRHIYRNSISNYAFLVVRMGLGAVSFRLIYQNLSKEDFGFWSLLWSLLGYGILLDFGFGFTAQKRVAELSVHRDWNRLSRVLSTIFFTYVWIAAGITILGYFGSPLLIKLFRISPEKAAPYTQILRFFTVGIGLAFPLGIFPEILRGQQRIRMTNNILLFCYVASFGGILAAIAFKWSLFALFAIMLGGTLAGDLICAFFAMRNMPQVKLSPKLFSREMVKDTTRFSVYAYVNTLTTLILTRTDQFVISAGIAVAAVAIYQAGAKVSEMFSSFALQIAETLSPAAAHLHAAGDRHSLRELLIKGTRFTTLLATPLYLCCAVFLSSILWVLTGEHLEGTQTYWVGQILLFWTYMSVVSQSVTKRIFMMCGHERQLMILGVSEGLLNLGLSIALVLIFRNVLCVAIGSLVATCIFGWGFIWPWAARDVGLSSWQLTRSVLLPAWVASVPLLGLLAVIRVVPDWPETFGSVFVQGSLAGVVAVIGLWTLALDDGERAKFSNLANRFLRRRVA